MEELIVIVLVLLLVLANLRTTSITITSRSTSTKISYPDFERLTLDVIGSRVEGEGPRSCRLRYAISGSNVDME